MAHWDHRKRTDSTGIGQLSLVEHSLCPLDRQLSLAENFVHRAEYRFSDPKRRRRTARARVFCPLGLSAHDEIYLWGLLGLTLSQPGDRSDLIATPHWCLKQLGIVNSGSGRGGEQYQRFRNALRRLSAVSYLCSAFYDPVCAEHREVSFHFFSYSLPVDPASSRAWRLSWDPTFIELTKHGASHLRFDLELYRSLDPASRRLFLFASKIFHRRPTLPQFDLQYLAVNVLGFSGNVALRDLRMKVLRCLNRLNAAGVVSDAEVNRVSKKQYVVNARRGRHFDSSQISESLGQDFQPVLESLVNLGFDVGGARRLASKYPVKLLEEWVDITQAKIERQGLKSFRKSPMAYLVDSVSKVHQGLRTAPDWWNEVRRNEDRDSVLSNESQELFQKIRSELFIDETTNSTEPLSGVTRTSDILKSIG